MTALILAAAITLSPMSQVDSMSGTCSTWHSWRVPPETVRVFRLHRRGSKVPRRVETWSFRRYVAAVMASGAWSPRVRESGKVGAIAIHGWAMWMVRHHQPGYSLEGRCYDVTDSDQFIRGDMRPWSKVPARTMELVRITWPVTLMKNGHRFRTGWSGGEGDSWHLGEDQVRRLAERGWGWRRIIHRLLRPVEIVE